MKVKPLPGFVVIEPNENESTAPGGIVLPDSTKQRQTMGAVVSVSDKAPVKVGDIAYYVKRWEEPEVKLDGKTYEFVKFEDLRGVYE